MSGSLQDALGGAGPLNGDSISLGQLKAMVGGAPKPKVCMRVVHGSSLIVVAISVRLQIRR